MGMACELPSCYRVKNAENKKRKERKNNRTVQVLWPRLANVMNSWRRGIEFEGGGVDLVLAVHLGRF